MAINISSVFHHKNIWFHIWEDNDNQNWYLVRPHQTAANSANIRITKYYKPELNESYLTAPYTVRVLSSTWCMNNLTNLKKRENWSHLKRISLLLEVFPTFLSISAGNNSLNRLMEQPLNRSRDSNRVFTKCESDISFRK